MKKNEIYNEKIIVMNSIEYHKIILKKVSFDEELLRKELRKALRNTPRIEQTELLKWCETELQEVYHKMMSNGSTFSPVYVGSNQAGVSEKENISKLLMIKSTSK